MNGWNHLSENGMATNADPVRGGIIDQNPVYGWFIIFNHEQLPVVEGLASKARAFEVFEKTIAGIE